MKVKAMREYIKENYLTVSDRGIADMFGVSVGGVAVARRRLGLRKSVAVAVELRDSVRGEVGAVQVMDLSRFW